MADVLVAEDYKSTRSALRLLLKTAGYEVRLAENGEATLRLYREKRPDLLLLDVMMPKKSGYQVLSEIRGEDPSLPVILLTAKSEKSDIVLGLGLGSDDYVTKPFDDDELLARIAAALRRAGAASAPKPSAPPAPSDLDAVFAFGSHRVDVRRLQLVDADGAACDLVVSEFKLLRLLAEHEDAVVRRNEIITVLWGENYVGAEHSVDQTISGLRRKLGADAKCIVTVYGAGYRYRPR